MNEEKKESTSEPEPVALMQTTEGGLPPAFVPANDPTLPDDVQKLVCVGCGTHHGFFYPRPDDKTLLWCGRCGTCIDLQTDKLQAMVPDLCEGVMTGLGIRPRGKTS